MVAVVGGPLEVRVKKGHRPEEEIEGLNGRVAHVGLVCEAAVVARRHGEAHEPEEDGEERRLPPADSEGDRIGRGAHRRR